MLEWQPGEEIELLLERIRDKRWKHQADKISDIVGALECLKKIDKDMKNLKEKFPSSFKAIIRINSRVAEKFHMAMFHLIEQIIRWMVTEDDDIENLINLLRDESLNQDKINQEKRKIFFEQVPEKGIAHDTIKWVIIMRQTVREAYKENHAAILKDIDHKLNELVDYMKRLEKHVEIEHAKINNAKEPVNV